jgi:hypothetical protein
VGELPQRDPVPLGQRVRGREEGGQPFGDHRDGAEPVASMIPWTTRAAKAGSRRGQGHTAAVPLEQADAELPL